MCSKQCISYLKVCYEQAVTLSSNENVYGKDDSSFPKSEIEQYINSFELKHVMQYQEGIERVLRATLDRCETCEDDPNPEYTRGALEVLGVFLGGIAYQSCGVGLGVFEALESAGDFVKKIEAGQYKDIDIKSCAEKFAEQIDSLASQ